MNRTGVFFIGALGYIATTVMAGTIALKKGLTGKTGMVTDLDAFSGLGLIKPEDIVYGGWDIRDETPLQSANRFFKSSQLPSELLPMIEGGLIELASNIYRGVTTNCGNAIQRLGTLEAAPALDLKSEIEKLRSDIRDFREKNSLDDVIVINLASTEPPLAPSPFHLTLDAFTECINGDRTDAVRASTLYAYAAVAEGCPYINFTPSNGALLPAILELAEKERVPVMGNDGKTGETLVKSALLPVFLNRNLEVLSWEGFNILGNMDGRVLDEPENKESKIFTKDRILPKVLGYTPHSKVHIHYVPSLDDQKTAWNFIHFKGFLGAKMSLQFTWQGYDSILAAPLVIDLARLAEFSKRRGESGPMKHLASFFKAPVDIEEHRFFEQFEMLSEYLKKAQTGTPV